MRDNLITITMGGLKLFPHKILLIVNNILTNDVITFFIIKLKTKEFLN